MVKGVSNKEIGEVKRSIKVFEEYSRYLKEVKRLDDEYGILNKGLDKQIIEVYDYLETLNSYDKEIVNSILYNLSTEGLSERYEEKIYNHARKIKEGAMFMDNNLIFNSLGKDRNKIDSYYKKFDEIKKV